MSIMGVLNEKRCNCSICNCSMTDIYPVCFRCDTAKKMLKYCDDDTCLKELREILADVNFTFNYGFKNIYQMSKSEIKKTIQDFLVSVKERT
jgi:hypothetical protein